MSSKKLGVYATEILRLIAAKGQTRVFRPALTKAARKLELLGLVTITVEGNGLVVTAP